MPIPKVPLPLSNLFKRIAATDLWDKLTKAITKGVDNFEGFLSRITDPQKELPQSPAQFTIGHYPLAQHPGPSDWAREHGVFDEFPIWIILGPTDDPDEFFAINCHYFPIQIKDEIVAAFLDGETVETLRPTLYAWGHAWKSLARYKWSRVRFMYALHAQDYNDRLVDLPGIMRVNGGEAHWRLAKYNLTHKLDRDDPREKARRRRREIARVKRQQP